MDTEDLHKWLVVPLLDSLRLVEIVEMSPEAWASREKVDDNSNNYFSFVVLVQWLKTTKCD
jgi:hypothetical protein